MAGARLRRPPLGLLQDQLGEQPMPVVFVRAGRAGAHLVDDCPGRSGEQVSDLCDVTAAIIC
ncbi:hypothetical protein [Streptomyces venezuelae]